MATLSRRLQILLDEQRYALLAREASTTGRPVAELVREAIDQRYLADLDVRRDAYHRILAADPMPVDDWHVMKAELVEALDDDDRDRS